MCVRKGFQNLIECLSFSFLIVGASELNPQLALVCIDRVQQSTMTFLCTLLVILTTVTVVRVDAYASMFRNYRCDERVEIGTVVMSAPAERDDERVLLVRAAGGDKERIACGGHIDLHRAYQVRLSAPGESSPVSYAEHVIEARGARFDRAARLTDDEKNPRVQLVGCDQRRVVGDYQASERSEVWHTFRVDYEVGASGVVLSAGWQRTMGALHIAPECRFTTGRQLRTSAQVPVPAPAPSNQEL